MGTHLIGQSNETLLDDVDISVPHNLGVKNITFKFQANGLVEQSNQISLMNCHKQSCSFLTSTTTTCRTEYDRVTPPGHMELQVSRLIESVLKQHISGFLVFSAV